MDSRLPIPEVGDAPETASPGALTGRDGMGGRRATPTAAAGAR